jgi:hypothetical protein
MSRRPCATSDELSRLSDIVGIRLVNRMGAAAVHFAKLFGLMRESGIEAIQGELKQLEQSPKAPLV